MKIIVEHVRSLAARQEIPLRPLTLLVGENSSGKSTFLAVTSAVLDRPSFPWSPALNAAPYNLGNFDTIATYKGGKYGRDEYFRIGYEDTRDLVQEAIATFESDHGQVVLQQFGWKTAKWNAEISVSDRSMALDVRRGNEQQLLAINVELPESQPRGAIQPFLLWDRAFQKLREKPEGHPKEVHVLSEVLNSLNRFMGSIGGGHSLAPVRSKPRRTYDEFSDEFSPEGDHIPALIARLLSGTAGQAESKHLKSSLERFGEESGLFRKLDVKRLGKHLSDPFQIQVSVAGPAVNLLDVGYGVSQALPIVVQSVLRSPRNVYLLQQPEVHLHPRAQAALGTFFVDLLAKRDRTFVVETHSDYLIDRVRYEVASKRIARNDVVILFFDKPNLETAVTPIELDDQGNVIDPPENYRRFFLEEEIRIFQGGLDECA